MAAEVPVDLVERQEWMEPVADGLQKAVASAYKAGGGAGRAIKNFLHGTWLGHPLHPVLTDIPVGAWTAALVMDAIDAWGGGKQYRRGADAAIGVGLVGAAAAAVAGLTDWQATDGGARRVGLAHGVLNLKAAALYTASWWLRRTGGDRGRARALATLGYCIAGCSAYLGGYLVYGKQIGVNHTAGEQFPKDFVAVVDEAELREGEPRRVNADGAKVLLLRRGGQNLCHRGSLFAPGRPAGGRGGRRHGCAVSVARVAVFGGDGRGDRRTGNASAAVPGNARARGTGGSKAEEEPGVRCGAGGLPAPREVAVYCTGMEDPSPKIPLTLTARFWLISSPVGI